MSSLKSNKNKTNFNIFLWISCGALFGIILALLVPTYLNWVERAGSIIKESAPSGYLDDMASDYTVALIMAILISLSIIFWPVQRKDKIHIFWMWAAKVIVTLGFLLVYEGVYDNDQFAYYAAAVEMSRWPDHSFFKIFSDFVSLLKSGIWHSNKHTGFIVRILTEPVPESYHAYKLILSLLGLISIYIFYRHA